MQKRNRFAPPIRGDPGRCIPHPSAPRPEHLTSPRPADLSAIWKIALFIPSPWSLFYGRNAVNRWVRTPAHSNVMVLRTGFQLQFLPIHSDKVLAVFFCDTYGKYRWLVICCSRLKTRPKLSHFQFTLGRDDQSCLTDVNDENNSLLYPKPLRTENTTI